MSQGLCNPKTLNRCKSVDIGAFIIGTGFGGTKSSMVTCSGSYINYIVEPYYGTLEYPERTPEVVERGVSM